jgi:hypothetical protein
MIRTVLTTALLLTGSGIGFAADFDKAFGGHAADDMPQGLLSGGVFSVYGGILGYEHDQVDIDDETQGIIGARGAYALPINSRISAQFDLIGELNATGSDDDGDLTRGDYMGAAHLNMRDPDAYLFGAFAGAGQSFDDGDNDDDPVGFWFVGVEGQKYLGKLTLGSQIGYVGSDENNNESIDDAWFARATAGYYFTENTKLSGDFAFFTGERRNGNPKGTMDVLSWGARVDHFSSEYPVGMFLAYNGFDYEGDRASDESDAPVVHEVRIGASLMLGASSLMENDRRGAGADLAPINRWISTSANEID